MTTSTSAAPRASGVLINVNKEKNKKNRNGGQNDPLGTLAVFQPEAGRPFVFPCCSPPASAFLSNLGSIRESSIQFFSKYKI